MHWSGKDVHYRRYRLMAVQPFLNIKAEIKSKKVTLSYISSGMICINKYLCTNQQQVYFSFQMSPAEHAQTRHVHECLDKIKRALGQLDETIFVISMYLDVCK